MKKVKIAISLDRSLLDLIDSKVDRSVIRSRSQAIELFLRRGIAELNKAVILLKGAHQKFALKKLGGHTLIKKQLFFLKTNGIEYVYIVTQRSIYTEKMLKEISEVDVDTKIYERNVQGTANALRVVQDSVSDNSFVVMSGDIYNNFDLRAMIRKHLDSNKIVTMGLISRGSADKISKCGIAVMDGDLIVDFIEKPKIAPTHIVNAGIYVFRPEIFSFLNRAVWLEKDVFPRLTKLRQIVGYFTQGEYERFAD